MQHKQLGFTIVELVVVILLLGILAATALPRFIDIENEAHEAAFNGVLGSLQTGISMFRAKAIASDAATNTPITDDFSGLRVNANGYPYGTDDNSSSGSDVTDSADCQAVFTNVQQARAPSVTNSPAEADVSSNGDGFDYTAVYDNGSCVYYYTGERLTGDVRTMTYDPATGLVSNTGIVTLT